MSFSKSNLLILKAVHRKAAEIGLKETDPHFESKINAKISEIESKDFERITKQKQQVSVVREKMLAMANK